MDAVNLVAVTSLKYKGKRLQKGDTFTAPRAHAKALKAIKRAADAPVAEPVATDTPTGTYQTKEMVAEAPDQAPETPSPRRTYRRRDQTPKP